MNFKFVTILLVAAFSQIANCESKSSDDEESKIATLGYLMNSAGSNTIICSDSAPAFSTLASAGVNSNCARSGCHDTGTSQNGLDMTSYNSVLANVTPSNGSASFLYQKISFGSMQVYTTSAINSAVYCWIQGGAKP